MIPMNRSHNILDNFRNRYLRSMNLLLNFNFSWSMILVGTSMTGTKPELIHGIFLEEGIANVWRSRSRR